LKINSEPRIAFIVDALPSLGGGEKVLFTALDVFPRADIFTLVYNQPVFFNTPIAQRTIKTSFINSIPLSHKYHRLFLPLMPRAIEAFDLHDYDTVVSFNYAVANGAKTNGAKHLSYTYTPMRYAWHHISINGKNSHNNVLIDHYLDSFRQWDRRAASRIGEFAAISQTISQRIVDSYQRESRVIYPPVDVERFKPNPTRDDFYITVTRLVPHKRVDLIVEAFSKLNLPLVIVGDGPELPRLQKMATPNIRFTGFTSGEQVAELLGRARGFICATEEDFGIAIVEAQAAGCPVIAYGCGGALETVVEGQTGLLFSEQSTGSLIASVKKFEESRSKFREVELIQNAKRFDKSRFMIEFKKFVDSKS